MRILVTGSKGMLGRDLVAYLEGRHQVIPVHRPEVDITDPRAIKAAIVQIPRGCMGKGIGSYGHGKPIRIK